MVGPRQALVKRTAAKKGVYTFAAGAGTAALFLIGLPWWLGIAGVAGTGYLAYDWLRYRGKWGIRF